MPQKPHPLQDVAEPNLIEETFDYKLPPLITFDGPAIEVIDGERVEFDPAALKTRDIHITDTTFRDGQQARPPYTIEQMVHIYDLLSRLGGPNGVIRQTEFFLYTKNDRATLDQCRELGHRYPECTGWIRAEKGDFRLVREAGLQETGMLTSCSDYHIFYKLKSDRKRIMDRYCEVVDAAFEAGVRPRCHLEDVTRADIEGFVLPFVDRLMEMSRQVPPEMSVKVRLCDTMGFGLSYPGAALPRSVPKLIHKLHEECGVPSANLEWHGHNDFHKVLVDASCAWLYGCCAANGTLLGFGERTGNPPIEGLIIEYMGLKGDSCGIDTTVITEIADYFRKEIGVAIPDNYPFVGRAFNVTRAGIHADGVVKNQEIYNIFDTDKLLNRPLGTAVTDKSGLAGIALWADLQLGLSGDNKISKKDPGVQKIADWVKEQYDQKRTTAISPEEMIVQAKKHLPKYFN